MDPTVCFHGVTAISTRNECRVEIGLGTQGLLRTACFGGQGDSNRNVAWQRELSRRGDKPATAGKLLSALRSSLHALFSSALVIEKISAPNMAKRNAGRKSTLRWMSEVGGGEGTAEESPPAGRVTDETDYFRLMS
jgi:hypothetical protein